jgi:hypothetical protein
MIVISEKVERDVFQDILSLTRHQPARRGTWSLGVMTIVAHRTLLQVAKL